MDPSLFDDDEDNQFLTAQEANEQFILDNLTLEKAVYLIFTHIPKLPNTPPSEFLKDYAAYVNQGFIGKNHLADVLAQQFIDAKVGPGVQIDAKQKAIEAEKRKREREEESRAEKVKNDMSFYIQHIHIKNAVNFRLLQRRLKFIEPEH